MSAFDEKDDIIDGRDFKGPSYNRPIQRIKVIGVGGGGNNAVIHMHKQGIKDVSFVLLNTDRQVLDSADVPTKVLIGPGLGAGGNPERARKYAEDDAGRIAELFDDQTDMVFITAGMGGGTGTGAGPVVARIAKEKGILTVGIVTVPFSFEGERKIAKAISGAEEMAKNVDSLLVINNERLYEIYQNLDILNAFAKADDTLLNAAQSITDIITNRGVINRDFNDVDTTLRDGGTAIISTGYGEGPDRVTAAIQDALYSPLLKDTDIFSSRKLLIVLYVSDDPEKHPFSMDELRALNIFVGGIVNDVDVMWGLYRQAGLDDKVRVTILASGFDATLNRSTNQPERKKAAAKPGAEGGLQIDEHIKNRTNQGMVIDPALYDNPNDQTIKNIENEPAISRNPYKNFMTGMAVNQFDNPSANTATPANKTNDDKAGGVILDFNDIN